MTEARPRISIIMPAYNVVSFVREAIASIAAQSFADFELIVIDDGSVDGTGALVAGEVSRIGQGRLRFFSQANRGAAATRNRGLSAASGQLIAFMDADDRWCPGTLAALVAALDQQPDLDLVFPVYRRLEADGSLGNLLPIRGGPRFGALDLLRDNPLHSATGVMVRRAAAARAGEFDETLTAYIDFDYWLRIGALRPGNIARACQAVVAYRRRPGQITGDWRRMKANHARIATKHHELSARLGRSGVARARARQMLYWCRLALAQGDEGSARLLWLGALRAAPREVVTRRYGVVGGVRCAATWLPPRMRETLADLVRSSRTPKGAGVGRVPLDPK